MSSAYSRRAQDSSPKKYTASTAKRTTTTRPNRRPGRSFSSPSAVLDFQQAPHPLSPVHLEGSSPAQRQPRSKKESPRKSDPSPPVLPPASSPVTQEIRREEAKPQPVDRPAGWNEDWVDPSAALQYICGTCHLVALDAVAHGCGAIFCRLCFQQWFAARGSCAACTKGADASPSHRDRQGVLSLLIRCPLQCGRIMPLAQLALHCREQCVRRRTPCRDCKELLAPGDVGRHGQVCQEALVTCSLCGQDVKRRQLAAHMKDQDLIGTHLSAVCLENQTLKRKVEELEAAVADLSLCLGMTYNKGQLEQSLRKSERLLRVAVAMNKDKDVDWLYPRAEQGDAAAARELGRCYAKGRGVDRDLAMAVRWYQTAAQQGLPVAQCDLGLCYKNGEGVEKNLTRAVKWWSRAAELGDSHAQYFLGLCYSVDHGPGAALQKNELKAVEWWSRAAKAGHVSAQFDLGVCYQRGKGVDQDLSRALLWFERAAVKGHVEAKRRLDKLQSQVQAPAAAQPMPGVAPGMQEASGLLGQGVEGQEWLRDLQG